LVILVNLRPFRSAENQLLAVKGAPILRARATLDSVLPLFTLILDRTSKQAKNAWSKRMIFLFDQDNYLVK
jgi:hypothetical protein